jgi:hypothetical protein
MNCSLKYLQIQSRLLSDHLLNYQSHLKTFQGSSFSIIRYAQNEHALVYSFTRETDNNETQNFKFISFKSTAIYRNIHVHYIIISSCFIRYTNAIMITSRKLKNKKSNKESNQERNFTWHE